MAKDKKKKNEGNSFNSLLPLPPGTMGNGSKIQLIDNRELCLEGCKGVLEYASGIIRLNLGNQQLKLLGRNLSIRVLERDYAEVEGYITAIEFV